MTRTLKSLPKSERGSFYAAENEIFREYRRLHARIIPDGAISERSYRASRLKVVVILKEPNDETGEWCDNGGDLRRLGYDGGKKTTWPNLARWSYLFQNPCASYAEAIAACRDLETRKKHLRRLVVMNLKKTPGASRSRSKEIEEFAERHAELLHRQSELYRPDLTLACGTHPIFTQLCGEVTVQKSKKYFSFFRHKSLGIVIDFFHPQLIRKDKGTSEEIYTDLARDLRFHGLVNE